MSLITRCPACGTMFKVVPDQLRVSEGWVRCGHCTEVFDATASLQDDAVPPVANSPTFLDDAEPAQVADLQSESDPAAEPGSEPESAAGPESEPDPATAVVVDQTGSKRTTEDDPVSDFLSSAIHTELPEDAANDAPDSEQLRAHEHSLRESALDQPFELRRPDREDEIVDTPLVSQPAPLEREPELEDLSFVREARRQEFWSAPSIRAALGLLLVVLSALLIVQYAIHNRDRLAAADPGLQPWITGLCAPFGCTIRPARQIESIAIDNSSFNRLSGDTYRLDVTVKNQSTTPSALPALELTLTDAQDEPVVRRVLLPAEIAPGTTVISAGADWATSVSLAVTANAATSRIAGYRVIAFYP